MNVFGDCEGYDVCMEIPGVKASVETPALTRNGMVKTKMSVHDTPDTTVLYECLICGVSHMLPGKGAICVAYADELPIGNICWECITKGPVVAQERLRSHVERIDELTKRLDTLRDSLTEWQTWWPMDWRS